MLKGAFIVAAGALAVAVFATAAAGPDAMAEAPKCKNKANKYVACTDKLRAKTRTRPAEAVTNIKKMYDKNSSTQP